MGKLNFGYKDKYVGKLFFLCWAAYFSTYICRLNFSAVMPELAKSSTLTESRIAAVSSAFFICYGAGQLFSGRLGDRLSPRIMIFSGVFISALSNILIFFFYKSYVLLLALWALNGAVQSMVWSPILRVAGDYFEGREKEKFGIDISTTVPLGTLASYGVSLLTLLFLPWNYVFLTCGLVVLLAAVYWLWGTGKILPRLKSAEKKADGEGAVISTPPMKAFIKICLSAGIFILIIPIAIQGTLKDSVTQWIPTFLDNSFKTGTGVSLLLTMVLPIINVTGAYFAKAVNKKFRNELKTSALFFVISMAFLVVLLLFGMKNIYLALVCMAGVTNCMFAVNVMLITMVPLHFSKYGCVSTMGGLLNAVAYIGCGILNLAAGELLKKSGSSWNSLFILWIALAAAALIFTGVSAVFWKRFTSKK